MFRWHSPLVAAGGAATSGGEALAQSMRPHNAPIDAAYRQLLLWLSSAPRSPGGRLAHPEAMLRALPFPLSAKGAGTLLALCDRKDQPSRDEFEWCVRMGEGAAGGGGAAEAPQARGRGVGHLCAAAAQARGSGRGKGGGSGRPAAAAAPPRASGGVRTVDVRAGR
ncbi:hypothetical protein AB1Y20_008863 [Prymnesium parvum]|uniref:Uncharacterized protein n=1 Tax=Prymnesium parvum TaxID=97485 RepID=A0AB34IUR6_PRYPA